MAGAWCPNCWEWWSLVRSLALLVLRIIRGLRSSNALNGPTVLILPPNFRPIDAITTLLPIVVIPALYPPLDGWCLYYLIHGPGRCCFDWWCPYIDGLLTMALLMAWIARGL